MLAVAVVKLEQESETLRFLKRKGIFPFGSECETWQRQREATRDAAVLVYRRCHSWLFQSVSLRCVSSPCCLIKIAVKAELSKNIFLLLPLCKRVGWHHFVPLSKNKLLNNPVGHFHCNRLNLVPSHAPFHNHLKYLLSFVPCALMRQNDKWMFMAWSARLVLY